MASSSRNQNSSSSGDVSRSVARGIPRSCGCGEPTLMRTSRTPLNPGRLFHCCPFRNERGNGHLFKWNDEAMIEEIEDLKEVVIDLKDCIRDYDNELKNIKDIAVGCEKELMNVKDIAVGCEKELMNVKESVRQVDDELKTIKAIVVGFGIVVAIGLYYVVL